MDAYGIRPAAISDYVINAKRDVATHYSSVVELDNLKQSILLADDAKTRQRISRQRLLEFSFAGIMVEQFTMI
jgi:hypothetical protein